jgi:hypothetical protein
MSETALVDVPIDGAGCGGYPSAFLQVSVFGEKEI